MNPLKSLKKWCVLFVSVALLTAFFTPLANAAEQLSDKEVVQGIKGRFEPVLYQLPPRIMGHYGIRLFRMTGDEKYRNAAMVDYYAVVTALQGIEPLLSDKAKVSAEAKRLTDKLSKGPRGRARKASLESYPNFIFYADALLRYAVRVHEFGGTLSPQVYQSLSSYDFETPLTDPVMVKAWAAQLANYAYWLKALGIVDVVDKAQSAFIATYPNSEDKKLKKWQFKNKVYGMTHFIFAASNYYQQQVDAKHFAWALDYFAANKKRIFDKTSADVIAEVGISYLLANKPEHDMVAAAKRAVKQAYDAEQSMIPSVSGKFVLASGEHRNVLAVMLLDWPKTLTPGPFIQ